MSLTNLINAKVDYVPLTTVGWERVRVMSYSTLWQTVARVYGGKHLIVRCLVPFPGVCIVPDVRCIVPGAVPIGTVVSLKLVNTWIGTMWGTGTTY